MAEWLFPLQHTNTNQTQHMDQKITHSFVLSGKSRRVEFSIHQISAYDDSNQDVSIFVGSDALNAGITKYLKQCSRQQQETFIQALNDHIRKTDNADA